MPEVDVAAIGTDLQTIAECIAVSRRIPGAAVAEIQCDLPQVRAHQVAREERILIGQVDRDLTIIISLHIARQLHRLILIRVYRQAAICVRRTIRSPIPLCQQYIAINGDISINGDLYVSAVCVYRYISICNVNIVCNCRIRTVCLRVGNRCRQDILSWQGCSCEHEGTQDLCRQLCFLFLIQFFSSLSFRFPWEYSMSPNRLCGSVPLPLPLRSASFHFFSGTGQYPLPIMSFFSSLSCPVCSR